MKPMYSIEIDIYPPDLIESIRFAQASVVGQKQQVVEHHDRLSHLVSSLKEARAIPAVPAQTVKTEGSVMQSIRNGGHLGVETPTVVEDMVNSPSHYTAYKGLEIIDLVEQMNFNRGNAVKYVCRAGLKFKATEIQDLQKAVWYLEREIERLENNTGVHPSN